MTDKEWEQFFRLLGKIIEMRGSHDDKRKEVQDRARLEEGGAETNLEEFVSWNWEF